MSERPNRAGNWVGLSLRLAIAGLALAWTASRLDFTSLGDAIMDVSIGACAGAVMLGFVSIGVGAIRWLILLRAYGAEIRPTLLFLTRAYLVGTFYNTFLPANVGGDLVRGHVTRRAFPGVASAYLIVAVERLYGLAGLMLLGASVLLVRPLNTDVDLGGFAALGLIATIGAVAIPLVGRLIGRRLPGKLGEVLSSLPRIRHPALLMAVLMLSVITQLCVAGAGYLLLASVRPSASLADALVLVPVAMAALYLPTVAGLGVREAAFVFFFGLVGVTAEEATATALAFFASQLVIALSGGALHALAPLSVPESDR